MVEPLPHDVLDRLTRDFGNPPLASIVTPALQSES
jgi:hypothetical protein